MHYMPSLSPASSWNNDANRAKLLGETSEERPLQEHFSHTKYALTHDTLPHSYVVILAPNSPTPTPSLDAAKVPFLCLCLHHPCLSLS